MQKLIAIILVATIGSLAEAKKPSMPSQIDLKQGQNFVQTCAGADDGQGVRSVYLINIAHESNSTNCKVATHFGFEYGNDQKVNAQGSFGSAFEIWPQDSQNLKCEVQFTKSKMTLTVSDSEQNKLVDSCVVGVQILKFE